MNEVIPLEQRSGAVAERLIEERLGRPVETISRIIWPDPQLPDIVDSWLDKYHPDVVFIRAASYWVAYESVPLRLQRTRKLSVLGDIGGAVGANARLASSTPIRVVRHTAGKLFRGDTYFTPEEATATVAASLRRILARESLVTIVRGPFRPVNSSGTRAGLVRAKRNCARLESSIVAVCGELHVPFRSVAGLWEDEPPLPDETHMQARTHAIIGKLEGEAIIHAVLEARH